MNIVLSSLPELSNWRTFWVNYLIYPLVDALFMLLISHYYTGAYVEEVLMANIVLTGAVTACTGFCSSFIGDIYRRNDYELVTNNPYNFYFWGTKWLVSVGMSYLLVAMNLLLCWAFGFIPHAGMGFLIAIPLLVYGSILGFTSAVIGWRMVNHYFVSNLVASFTIFLGGALLPFEQYPPIFKQLSYLLPFARTNQWLYGKANGMWQDMVIALIWLAVGMIAFQYQLPRIAKRTKQGIL
ncbi:MAG: hypothetical protein Q4A67_06280 [Aerococcus sp.]|nr:hypothetical protein [Aerococcus sp.]